MKTTSIRSRRTPHLLASFLLLVFLSPTGAAPCRADVPPPSTGTVSGRHENRREPPRPEPVEIHTLLFQANQAYLDGKYEEAASLYREVIHRGHLNGHVFYNLGNAEVRLGRIGPAILNYKKAALLLPRDGDLKANLQYARSLARDRIDGGAPPFWHALAFWYFGMNFRELLVAFLVFHALFWGAAILHIHHRNEWLRWGIGLSLLLSLLFGVSAGLKAWETFRNSGGVVLEKEVPVRAGFTRKDTTLFVLHEGAEFRILGRERGWWKIALPDGKKGWLPATAAARVALTAGR